MILAILVNLAMMTFVGPKHPVFNIIEAVNKAANVVTGDTPETRHLNISNFLDWCDEYDWKNEDINCTKHNELHKS